MSGHQRTQRKVIQEAANGRDAVRRNGGETRQVFF
jgi:hypothetical protein